MKKNRITTAFTFILGLLIAFSASGCSSSETSLPESPQQEEHDQKDQIIEQEENNDQSNGYSNTEEQQEASITCLREYVFPTGDVPVFSVSQKNYHQKMPIINYEVFDAEDILRNKLSATVSIEEKDTDNDGHTDELRGTGDTIMWAFKDENADGMFDFCVALESNFDSSVDFRIEWRDRDYNGTMDEVTIYITNTDDLGKGVFSTQYLYGDFSDIDFDTGKADYTNRNRVQFIQAVTLPENSPFNEQQLFRDLNGDGKIDWMQTRKYYDTNYDGVQESMKISNDRNMDGIFEDEFVFDGKILENSLLY